MLKMYKRKLILGALVAQTFLPVSAQQVDSNSITVSSSKTTANLTPDQVVFAITVSPPLNTNLSDVLPAVQSAGLTSANFSNVYTNQIYNTNNTAPPVPVQVLAWSFTLPVPFAKIKDTVTTLTNLQNTLV